MNTEQITTTVDDGAAKNYRNATPDERRKLHTVLNLRLHDAAKPTRSLRQLREEISDEARRRSLTEEILAQLLKDD